MRTLSLKKPYSPLADPLIKTGVFSLTVLVRGQLSFCLQPYQGLPSPSVNTIRTPSILMYILPAGKNKTAAKPKLRC